MHAASLTSLARPAAVAAMLSRRWSEDPIQVICGPPGSGRTTLLDQLAERHRAAGELVLHSGWRGNLASTLYAALCVGLRDRRAAPGITRLLDGLGRASSLQLASVAAGLAELAAVLDVVLVMDDLDRGPVSGHGLIAQLAQVVGDAGVQLIVAVVQQSELLRQLPATSVLVLEPLDEAGVSAVAAGVLGRAPDPVVLARLRRTDCQPASVVRCCRSLLGSDRIGPIEARAWLATAPDLGPVPGWGLLPEAAALLLSARDPVEITALARLLPADRTAAGDLLNQALDRMALAGSWTEVAAIAGTAQAQSRIGDPNGWQWQLLAACELAARAHPLPGDPAGQVATMPRDRPATGPDPVDQSPSLAVVAALLELYLGRPRAAAERCERIPSQTTGAWPGALTQPPGLPPVETARALGNLAALAAGDQDALARPRPTSPVTSEVEQVLRAAWDPREPAEGVAAGQLALVQGRWDEALEHVARFAGQPRTAGHRLVQPVAAAVEIEILASRGQLGRAWRAARQAGSSRLAPPLLAWAMLRLRVASGEVRQAELHGRQVLRECLGDAPMAGTAALAGRLLGVQLQLGLDEAAEDTLRSLLSATEPADAAWEYETALALARHHRNRASARRALGLAGALNSPRARIRALAAAAVLGLNGAEAIEEALLLSDELGSVIDRADLTASARGLGYRTGRERRGPAGITGTERLVVELIARDRSNRQIAAVLQVSDKRVEKIVHDLLQRTGQASRLTLAGSVLDRWADDLDR